MLSNNGYGVKDKLLLVMTQEEKQLLLVDLCGRLPYGVKISVNDDVESLQGISAVVNVVEYGSFLSSDIDEVKPYLFPLSSMTKEQRTEYEELYTKYNYLYGIDGKYMVQTWKIDWCNRNHFDYRGLIPMGLAIDATNLNIY
jgi:hypothetical protein